MGHIQLEEVPVQAKIAATECTFRVRISGRTGRLEVAARSVSVWDAAFTSVRHHLSSPLYSPRLIWKFNCAP